MFMKKIIALVLVTVLALVPLAALAETETISTRFNNFQLGLNGVEKRDIALDLELNALESGDTFGLNGTAKGGEVTIASGQLASDGKNITLGMKGLSSNYTFNIEKLMAKIQSEFESATASSDMPFTSEDISKLMNAYMNLIKSAIETGEHNKLSNEDGMKMLESLGTVKGEPETVTVNGTELTMPRYELTIDNNNIDQFFLIYDELIPGYSNFMIEYVNFLAKATDLGLPEGASISELFNAIGMNMTIDCVFWADMEGNNMLMEVTETMTMQHEGGEPETVSMPFTIEVTSDGMGNDLVNMSTDIEGDKLIMTMAMNDRRPEAGADGDFSFALSAVNSDGSDAFTMTMDGAARFDADDVGTFKTEFALEAPGFLRQMFEFNVDKVKGSAHVFTSSTTTDLSVESEPIVCTFEFDVSTSKSESGDQSVFDDGGKPTLDLLELTDEQMKTLRQELKTQMIVMLGSFMQTPGVAETISDAFTAMEALMDKMPENMDEDFDYTEVEGTLAA